VKKYSKRKRIENILTERKGQHSDRKTKESTQKQWIESIPTRKRKKSLRQDKERMLFDRKKNIQI
jgi:hypothetical protein